MEFIKFVVADGNIYASFNVIYHKGVNFTTKNGGSWPRGRKNDGRQFLRNVDEYLRTDKASYLSRLELSVNIFLI